MHFVAHLIAYLIARFITDARARTHCAHACPMALQFLLREGPTSTAPRLFSPRLFPPRKRA